MLGSVGSWVGAGGIDKIEKRQCFISYRLSCLLRLPMPDKEEVLPVFLLLLPGKIRKLLRKKLREKHFLFCRLTTKLPNHGKLISKKKTLDQASEYIGHMESLLRIKAKGRVGIISAPIQCKTTNIKTNTSSTTNRTITIPLTANPTTN